MTFWLTPHVSTTVPCVDAWVIFRPSSRAGSTCGSRNSTLRWDVYLAHWSRNRRVLSRAMLTSSSSTWIKNAITDDVLVECLQHLDGLRRKVAAAFLGEVPGLVQRAGRMRRSRRISPGTATDAATAPSPYRLLPSRDESLADGRQHQDDPGDARQHAQPPAATSTTEAERVLLQHAEVHARHQRHQRGQARQRSALCSASSVRPSISGSRASGT